MKKNTGGLEYSRIKSQLGLAKSGLYGILALSTFSVIALWDHLVPSGLITWFLLINTYNTIRIQLIRKYYNVFQAGEMVNLRSTENYFYLTTIISAISWISLLFLPSRVYILEYLNHLEVILGCSMIAAMATLSYSLRSSITFILIVVSTFLYKVIVIESIQFQFTNTAIFVFAMATIALCIYLYKIQMGSLVSVLASENLTKERDAARKQYKKLNEDLKKRLENERLIAHGLQEALDFQASILENSLSGIYVIGKDGLFVQSNDVGANILGYTKEELFGKSSNIILFGEQRKIIRSKFKELLRRKKSIKGFASQVRRKDGTIIDIQFNASPILKNDEVIGSVCSLEDITHRNRIEVIKKIRIETLENLARGKDLKLILEKIINVYCQINPQISSTIIFYDQFSGRLLHGVSVGIPSFFIEQVNNVDISQKDFPCVQAILKKKIIKLDKVNLNGKSNFSNLLKKTRFKSSLSQPILDSKNNILGVYEVFSTLPEISKNLDEQILDEFLQLVQLSFERKLIEEQLVARNKSLLSLYKISSAVFEEIELKKLFEKIFKALSEIQEIESIVRVKIFMNDHGKLNLYYDSMENRDPSEDVCMEKQKGQCLCELAYNSGEVVISENLYRHSSKTSEIDKKHHSHIIVPLIGREKISGVLCLHTIMKISKTSENEKYFFLSAGRQIGLAIENASLYEELKTMSLNDPLTGLANRHRMKIMVQKLIPMAKRKKEPFSVAFLDLDFFKEFNDQYGHAAGDSLLEDVANIMKQNVREEDLAVRHGGEEFLLIFTNTGIEAAEKVLERIRIQVTKKTRVSISAGLALYDFKSTFEELLDHADQALYQAKNTGRNRIVIWNTEVEI